MKIRHLYVMQGIERYKGFIQCLSDYGVKFDDDYIRWYSTKEICAYLGISRDTMLVWISTKNMPAHKVGRNWKFKVSEVDEWIKSGKAAE